MVSNANQTALEEMQIPDIDRIEVDSSFRQKRQ
jgi:hypothetical protein